MKRNHLQIAWQLLSSELSDKVGVKFSEDIPNIKWTKETGKYIINIPLELRSNPDDLAHAIWHELFHLWRGEPAKYILAGGYDLELTNIVSDMFINEYLKSVYIGDFIYWEKAKEEYPDLPPLWSGWTSIYEFLVRKKQEEKENLENFLNQFNLEHEDWGDGDTENTIENNNTEQNEGNKKGNSSSNKNEEGAESNEDKQSTGTDKKDKDKEDKDKQNTKLSKKELVELAGIVRDAMAKAELGEIKDVLNFISGECFAKYAGNGSGNLKLPEPSPQSKIIREIYPYIELLNRPGNVIDLDYSWLRRHPHFDWIKRKSIRRKLSLSLFLDISGSMSSFFEDIARAIIELENSVRIFLFDDKVKEWSATENLSVGGGTLWKPVEETIEQENSELNIVVSDMDFYDMTPVESESLILINVNKIF